MCGSQKTPPRGCRRDLGPQSVKVGVTVVLAFAEDASDEDQETSAKALRDWRKRRKPSGMPAPTRRTVALLKLQPLSFGFACFVCNVLLLQLQHESAGRIGRS